MHNQNKPKHNFFEYFMKVYTGSSIIGLPKPQQLLPQDSPAENSHPSSGQELLRCLA
jgi:hypothetical protein